MIMKKTLLVACAMIFAASSAVFAADAVNPEPAKVPVKEQECNLKTRPHHPSPDFKKRQADFENRLQLTEEQKAQAEQIRKKGHEEMKPIMDQIRAKRQEAEAVKRSRMSERMQRQKLAQIDKDIAKLKNEANMLRVKNMREFESILTVKQKQELKKMKEEGRKEFQKKQKRGGGHLRIRRIKNHRAF